VQVEQLKTAQTAGELVPRQGIPASRNQVFFREFSHLQKYNRLGNDRPLSAVVPGYDGFSVVFLGEAGKMRGY